MSTPQTGPSPSDKILAAGLQKIDIKIPVEIHGDLSHDDICDRLIAIFGRWRTEEGEEIVDLQDYSHVEHGPGVVLVSKRWILSIDFGAPSPGVLLSTRKGLDGSLDERLEQAVRHAYRKATRLLAEKELDGTLTLSVETLHLSINDRMLFANTQKNADELAGPLEDALRRVAGGDPHLLRDSTPVGRLGFQVALNAPAGTTPEQLAAR